MSVILGVVLWILYLFFFLLLARLVFDYVQMFARSWRPSGFVVVLLEIIYTVTDPPLKALRRVIPPLRIGNFSLDLGFLVLTAGIWILIGVVSSSL